MKNKVIEIFKKAIQRIINYFFHLFRINEKLIVFESGRGIVDGNVYAVYDYIKQNCSSEFETIWLVKKGTYVSKLKKGDYVYYYTLKSYYYLATAHYWIRSQSIGNIIKKREKQVYIQLWHGNGALKYMKYDSNNAKNRPPLEHVLEWDYFIANDYLDAQHIISSTGYNKKVDILGMGCMDITLKYSNDDEYKKTILKKIGVNDTNKKIILYAPTFRDYELENSDIINIPINKLSKLDNYLIFVRLHPLVRTKINKDIFKNKNFINVCDYPDVSDLLPITDVLITDYSSIFYQFSPLNRPIIFYPYDFDLYVKLRGGFYLDYKKELPGIICYNEDCIIKYLLEFSNDNDRFKKAREKFNLKYNYLADGNACKRFVDKLRKKYYDN